ncbi:MAG: hypothetical protein ABSG93_02500 [Solirubrobacteraceae bacterium]
MAQRNPGRRGRSRKRRPSGQSASDPAQRPAPAARPAQRAASALGDLKASGERPHAPWHPLPLSELLILVGAIGTVVAYLRGVESNGALLGAGIGAVVIGTIEVTLREHLSGFRSHTLMLSVLPAIVFHSAVVLVVLALNNRAPGWLNVALLPIDVALVALCFKLLRARYVDARRERTFAGLR